MRRKLIVRIFGIALVFVMTVSMLGGLVGCANATPSLDDDPLHQLPAKSGKISYFASDDGHPGVCDPAAWGEVLGEQCGMDDATKYWYCAMRWPYVNGSTEAKRKAAKAWWHNKKILVTNPKNGEQVILAAKDWGPAEETKRVIDVSKTALNALGAMTDNIVSIEFAEQNAPLGVAPPSYFSKDWVEKVIDWAFQQKGSDYWYDPAKKMGFCMAFVSDAFKVCKNRPGSPNILKNNLKNARKFHSKENNWDPPRGSLVFFSCTKKYAPYGHIGISLGDRKVIHAYNKVREQTIKSVVGLSYIDSYLGWAYPPKEWFSPQFSNKFKEGCYVSKGEGWRLRDIPSLYGKVLSKTKGNGQIIEDEINGICNAGHYWWHVRIGDIHGWCAEEGLSKRTEDRVKPVSASDIILVMDTSGSMGDKWEGEMKLSSAKKAAKALIGLLSQGTTIAVVTFADNARMPVGLTSDFDVAEATIEGLRAGGKTNVGDALNKALDELETHSQTDARKAIIFFTDGHITTGIGEDDVLAGPVNEATNKQIVIYAIGYGDPSYLRAEFLKKMAEKTGGEYYYSTEAFQLQNVFIEAGQRAEGWKIESTFTGRVKPQETVTAGTFDLASRAESLKVILNWPGSNLDLKIFDPRGKELDYVAPNVVYSGDVKPEYVLIKNPLRGTWSVKVHGKIVPSTAEYCLWIATYTTLHTPSSFIQFIPLVVSIALLLFIIGYFARRSM